MFIVASFAWWGVTTGVLLHRERAVASPRIDEAMRMVSSGETVMDVYVGGVRVGTIRHYASVTAAGITSNIGMRLGNTPLVGEMTANLTVLLDERLYPLRVDGFVRAGKEEKVRLYGKRSGKIVRIHVSTGKGRKMVLSLPTGKVPRWMVDPSHPLPPGFLKAGSSLQMYAVDPLTMRLVPVTIRVKGKEQLETGEGMKDAWLVTASGKGLPEGIRMWCAGDGKVLQVEMGRGIKLVRRFSSED